MDYIWRPTKLLYGFKYTSCEEDCSFSIVFEEIAVSIVIDALAVEIILVVDEVYLHSCCRDRCDLDDKWSVNIVYDYVHTREADNLMKLILSFVDAAISRHEGSYLLLPFLDALRKLSSDICDR